MKKSIVLLIAGLSFSALHSQNGSDAIRYAQENLNGSARFRAMGGAFGAVGGDLSAINVNPAGSAIFANSQIGISISDYNTNTKSDYFGTKTSESNIAFDLNQLGGVFIFYNHAEKTGWKKFALSVNYDNANDFDNTLYRAGTNPGNSVASYFMSYANQAGLTGNDYETYYFDELTLRERQGFLGYDSGAIAAAGGNLNNNTFVSNIPGGGNYFQDEYITTAGYNGKLSFNVSTAYNDRFYFGLNINTYFTDYSKFSSFYEENSNSPLPGTNVQNLTFDNDIHTYGNGFSFQLGAIAKITNSFRAGLAYESPTWYEFNDEVRQIVYTNGAGLRYGNSGASNSDFYVLYDPYNLKTPSKFTGSLAYVFGKSGLLSVDYSVKDYSNTRFSPKDDYFNPINTAMSNNLTVAGELRIGAEYRIKNWSLRGGLRHEDSPYKNNLVNAIGDLTSFSGGFGYAFTRTRVDLSYTHSQRESQEGFFSQGLTDPIKTKTQNNNISLGLTFEL
ncbi:MAG TPA: outer membrane protein transport protein [Flavobacterium sp.]|nr:outer membrane protein transport protein [Flavobacterium sp.]